MTTTTHQEAVKVLRDAIEKHIDPSWECNSDHPALRAALAATSQVEAATSEAGTYVECRECSNCTHVGINDADGTHATCGNCDWSGPSPKEDCCPGCAQSNCMGAACPKCGGRYSLLADATVAAPLALPATEPIIAKHASRDDFSQSTVTGYAQFLAWAIWRDHYQEASPNFMIMGDALGALSQIDNMVCGWKAAPATQAKPDLSGLPKYQRPARGWQEGTAPYRTEPFYAVADIEALLAHPVAQVKPEGDA